MQQRQARGLSWPLQSLSIAMMRMVSLWFKGQHLDLFQGITQLLHNANSFASLKDTQKGQENMQKNVGTTPPHGQNMQLEH